MRKLRLRGGKATCPRKGQPLLEPETLVHPLFTLANVSNPCPTLSPSFQGQRPDSQPLDMSGGPIVEIRDPGGGVELFGGGGGGTEQMLETQSSDGLEAGDTWVMCRQRFR